MKCEILAPAGSKEQLEAAVRSGANAVYLGVKGFNARNNAENFDENTLSDAVSYCHARGVKVYVAFNIIVFDKELEKAIDTAKIIAQSGADGVIVQDMGVATIFKKCCPDMPIHISTQGAIHNSLGVDFASNNGFSRCILARELSFDEIKEICSKKPENMELETFVHGALCVSASGNCLLSACIGGRSGNRGVCAQPCRLNFKHNGREFALSFKDMSYVENAKNIADLGISSLKIEGRMKRAEYVAAVVNQLNKALNDEDIDVDVLNKVFSRSGFTTGYFDAKRDGKMFGIRTKENVLSSGEIQNSLHELYKREHQSVPVNMELRLNPEKNAVLSTTDGVNKVSVEGIIPFVAENKPTNEESAYNFLSKLGGTPFFLDSLKVLNDDNLMLPPSSLKDMRRRCEQELLSLRSQVPPYDFQMNIPEIPLHQNSFPTKFIVRGERVEQLENLTNEYVKILPLDKIGEDSQRIGVDTAELPALMYEGDIDKIKSQLEIAKQYGITRLYCENIGGVWLAKQMGFGIIGGINLNISNTLALEFYKALGLEKAVLSVEINSFDIERLKGTLERGAVCYGYLPLMRLRSCPARGENGCGDCDGSPELVDRMDKTFKLMCHNKKYSTLLNSVPLYIGDKPLYGTDFGFVYFTNETPEECVKIMDLLKTNEYPPFDRTRGLYYR